MNATIAVADFLRGGGEMGWRTRALDWSRTPVGAVEDWPQSLRTALSILLGSGYPMYIAWGPEFTQFYNDAYRPILGATKHPAALGQGTPECFAEIWSFIGPMFHRAMDTGEATTLVDQLLPLDRNGYIEECYFTFSYSAIREESGRGGGVFVTVIETTERVLAERRLRTLRDLAARSIQAKNAAAACAAAAETLAANPYDVPCSAIYLLGDDGKHARLAGIAGLPAGTLPAELRSIAGEGASTAIGTAIGRALLSGQSEFIGDLQAEFGTVWSRGAWPEPPNAAVVLPVLSLGRSAPAASILLAINPRKAYDDDYRAFFSMIAGHVAAAITEAEEFETQRKRAEALTELDRAKTAFFGNVSHEFRTPLTLMLGPLEEILARSGEFLDGRREELELVHRNGLRLLKLVNSLLEFSRIEAGRVQAQYQALDVALLTTDLASTFRSMIEKAGLQFLVDCPPLPEPVYVDSQMWEKIVLNLLSNAFKFTFAGQIAISLRAGTDSVTLTVADTGAGIPAAEIPRLFERFHRVEGALGRSYEGTGIGLALVGELVKLHGGSIEVNSVEGEGSTFRVTVPLGMRHLPLDQVRTDSVPATTAAGRRTFVDEAARWLPVSHGLAGPPEANQPSGGRILVADDNADMREYVTRILSGRYQVQPVGSGLEALSAARQQCPDLVLSDVMMPGIDGFELLKRLRSDPATAAVPVIVLSARAGEESRHQGLEAGADDYLVKPFTANELLARVGSHVSMARHRKAVEEALRETEGRFRALADAAPVLIWQSGADTQYTYFNQVWLDFTGRSSEREQGHGWREGVHPGDLERCRDTYLTSFGKREPFSMEYRLQRHDGEYRWLLDHGVPRFTDSGDFAGYVGSCVDITDRKAVEDSLLTANRDLEQFAYAASHDLQEPLRNITNYSQLLVRQFDQVTDEHARRFVAHIIEGTARMQLLLSDLLAFSSLTTSKQPVDTILDTNAVLAEVLENLRTAIQDCGAAITCDRLPPVKALRAHIMELLQNLIGNALKYRGDQSPRVHVSAERQGHQSLFSVRDNGIGIDPRYSKTIFGLFKRLHGREKYQGTGIGLAICSKVVERYGGRIWVESEFGKGANFLFTFPAVEQ